MLNCDRDHAIDVILVVYNSGDTPATVYAKSSGKIDRTFFFDATINYIKDFLKNIT